MLGQQQPCKPPPGKCSSKEDCEGLIHDSCPGQWTCDKKGIGLYGDCEYQCIAKDGYCNEDMD